MWPDMWPIPPDMLLTAAFCCGACCALSVRARPIVRHRKTTAEDCEQNRRTMLVVDMRVTCGRLYRLLNAKEDATESKLAASLSLPFGDPKSRLRDIPRNRRFLDFAALRSE